MEIKISPSAIKKKHQNGSSLVSIGPREKVQNNNPPQFWVKESICVNGNQNFTLAIKKKHQNGSSLVSVGPREKTTPHNFGSRNPSVSTKFHLRPLRKSTKMGLAWCPFGPRVKVWINHPPFPTILGQGIHLCRRKSKFHLRSLRKSTKMGLAWCPLCQRKSAN